MDVGLVGLGLGARGIHYVDAGVSGYARFRSRQENSFADRLLAALRNAFGGHAVRR
jgi:6-phosphogluconate dehydrogenase (decarboxylating)